MPISADGAGAAESEGPEALMAWGLNQLSRASRAQRAGFAETRDLHWHRLVPGSCVGGTAVVACTRTRVVVRRTASDMVAKELTCPACRGTESETNDGPLG